MNQIFKQFVIALFLFVGLTFGLHLVLLYIAEFPLFENKIIASYIVNLILALLIFSGLFFLRNKFKNQIGFLFMGGSFLKFFVATLNRKNVLSTGSEPESLVEKGANT